jgi:hypothetical protein
MKRQRRITGTVVRIPLGSEGHGYGVVLERSSLAVLDLLTSQELPVEAVLQHKTLFVLTVYNNAITSGRWTAIGREPLQPRFIRLPLQYIQDSVNPDCFQIYDPNLGTMAPATKEECAGLEAAAVWEAEHVESRISDHFSGKKNVWVKQLEIK